jgi:hypothetical protein
MHVPDVVCRSRPGVKTRIARLAAPGTHPGYSHDVILCPSPAGTSRTVAMTDRAEQEFFTPGNSADKDTCIVPHMASPPEDIVTQPAMKRP